MKSQTATKPITKNRIQNAMYHGGRNSYTTIPPMTKNATPYACCQKSSTWTGA